MTPEIACTSNFQTPPTPRKSLKNIFSVQQHTFRRSRTLLINSRRHYELTTPCVSSSLCTCFSICSHECLSLSVQYWRAVFTLTTCCLSMPPALKIRTPSKMFTRYPRIWPINFGERKQTQQIVLR